MEGYLSKFERKLIDNLTVELVARDGQPGQVPSSPSERVANLERAAQVLDCSVAELVVHYLSVDVLTHTPRHEGFFGADNGDFYFDLDYVRECLKRNSRESSPLRYARSASN